MISHQGVLDEHLERRRLWKNTFFVDLHGQGRDAIEFYADTKVVVERWAKEQESAIEKVASQPLRIA